MNIILKNMLAVCGPFFRKKELLQLHWWTGKGTHERKNVPTRGRYEGGKRRPEMHRCIEILCE